MVRLNVQLSEQERDAIWALATQERRDPRDQAALIIRRELERLGLIPPEETANVTPMQPVTNREVQNATATR